MIQRHQPHPPGTFAACVGCRREPKHIVSAGSSNREPILSGGPSERHALECARCGRSTARYATLTAAIDEWGAVYSQAPLPLPTRVVRIAHPRKRAAA